MALWVRQGVAKCPLFSFAGNLSSCDFRWETDTGRSKHPALGQCPSVSASFRDGESLLGLTMNRKVIKLLFGFSFFAGKHGARLSFFAGS